MSDQDDGRWEQEQQRDMDALEQAAEAAVLAALHRPLTESEVMTLAHCSGIANRIYKEIRK